MTLVGCIDVESKGEAEVLDMAMPPLALAQEIVAVEAGYASWPELRTAVSIQHL